MRATTLLILAHFVIGPCLAGPNDNYPFTVESEPDGDGHRIVARNNGPAPVSVKVALLYSVYATPDRTFPVFAVVPPNGGVLHLGRFKRTISGVGYSFRYSSSWLLGDFNARQSADALYRLPYRDGSGYPIGQAPGGANSTHHSAESAHAVDIVMPQDTPVLAARDGTVIYTEANQRYGGKTPDLLDKANEVRIRHADGTIGVYAHLAHGGVQVYPGQRVAAGEQIGLVGSTGYSSGPHLHFVVQQVVRNGDDLGMASIPFRFYVGNPPVPFHPKSGALIVADYSSSAPASNGAYPRATQDGASTGLLPQVTGSFPTTSDLFLKTGVLHVGTYMRALPAWVWFAMMFGVVFVLLRLGRWRAERRMRAVFEPREPSLGTRRSGNPDFGAQTPWARLLRACGGDIGRAERLMDYEQRKAPGISRDEAASRASERLERDRR
ncbi:M23 family metallopeptidase [Aromatoleum toluolicum]|uniref:Peptidoglycan DD-metalloendopeptidase family protein n=1 Tax=Aromatoleum toluolicum TaxID=90060 RepID=A0ABX1NPJ2_9RHOO|nr:M23 family metallopeptidase [Aromatoleum toluolicum]NMG01137.1 M23 family metallopeptidase [Aromatoleum toluolicum]